MDFCIFMTILFNSPKRFSSPLHGNASTVSENTEAMNSPTADKEKG
jgi:hypothetical protein